MADTLQIKFEFNAVEDRLLLHISENQANGRVEYRFWLTRRFVAVCLGAIDKLIEDELAGDMQISPEAMDAMKKFQHEAALAKADFETSYGEGAADSTVYRENPLLITTLKIHKKSKDRYVLSFLDQGNAGIHLRASIDLLHSVQKMLVDSVRNAGWNKPLLRSEDASSETETPSGYVS